MDDDIRCWNDLAEENARLREALANAAQIAEGTPTSHRSGSWLCDGDPLNPRRLWTEGSMYHSGRVDAAREILAAINETHKNEPIFSPMEEAIWQTIKGWDISRGAPAGYAAANGDDVRTIAKAVRQCFGPCPDYGKTRAQEPFEREGAPR